MRGRRDLQVAQELVHDGHAGCSPDVTASRFKTRSSSATADGKSDHGLRTARAHLAALGAPEPEMPPYDASTHEPIEEIPIEREDEQSV